MSINMIFRFWRLNEKWRWVTLELRSSTIPGTRHWPLHVISKPHSVKIMRCYRNFFEGKGLRCPEMQHGGTAEPGCKPTPGVLPCWAVAIDCWFWRLSPADCQNIRATGGAQQPDVSIVSKAPVSPWASSFLPLPEMFLCPFLEGWIQTHWSLARSFK